MGSKKESLSPLTREQALRAHPVRTRAVECREDPAGALHVTLLFQRAPWLGWLGGGGETRRTFVLDALGKALYQDCDGRRRVEELIEDFAQKHHVSPAEAEYSVTTFLRTMVQKGLVAMAVEKGEG